MARVLLTGATGFVGRQALAPLLAAGHEVHATTSRAPLADAPAEVRWHVVDLHDEAATRALVQRVAPSDLLHLAWYAEPGAFWTSEENLRWVAASLGLLRAFAAGGGRRAVMAGTCAEYAWEPRTHCVEDATPLVPATLYGAAKHGLRTIAQAYADGVDVSFAWGRIFFLYGPHEDPRRLVGSVARALTAGERAETSHGRQVRDFLSTPDVARGFAALLDSDVRGAVNIASGVPVELREVIEAVGVAAGRPDLLDVGARPSNPSEPERLTADVTRLRDEVGFVAPTSLADGVAEAVAWWRELSPDDPRRAPA